jgi:hypothetical protein
MPGCSNGLSGVIIGIQRVNHHALCLQQRARFVSVGFPHQKFSRAYDVVEAADDTAPSEKILQGFTPDDITDALALEQRLGEGREGFIGCPENTHHFKVWDPSSGAEGVWFRALALYYKTRATIRAHLYRVEILAGGTEADPVRTLRVRADPH